MDELDKEILEAPYRKLQAIEDHSEHSYLLKLYQNCFENTYKSRYISNSIANDRTLIEDIKRMVPDKAAQIIEHYFKMKDDWFKKTSHSLETLKRNINAVNADLEKRSVSRPVGTITINVLVTCDECFKHFELWAKPESLDSDKKRLCKACKNPLGKSAENPSKTQENSHALLVEKDPQTPHT